MPGDTLTHRERWLRTVRYQPVDRVPDLEFSAWQQTIARWRQEGMETYGQTGSDLLDVYFGTDSAEYGPDLWIGMGLLPGFEPQVLEEHGTHQIILDADGALAERLTTPSSVRRSPTTSATRSKAGPIGSDCVTSGWTPRTLIVAHATWTRSSGACASATIP